MAENQNATTPSGHQPDNSAVDEIAKQLQEAVAKTPLPPHNEPAPEPPHNEPALEQESVEARAERLKAKCRKQRESDDKDVPTLKKSCEDINPQKGTEMQMTTNEKFGFGLLVLILAIVIGWYFLYQMPKNEKEPVTVASTKSALNADKTVSDNQLVVDTLNQLSGEVGSLKKEIAELKALVAKVEECACKKPKQPVKKVVPKPKQAPAPTVAPPAPAPAASAPLVTPPVVEKKQLLLNEFKLPRAPDVHIIGCVDPINKEKCK